MSLPSLAPFPPAGVRLSLRSEDWEACLEAWLALADHYLRLNQTSFASFATADTSLIEFLISYYRERSQSSSHDVLFLTKGARQLQNTAFLLLHRALMEVDSCIDLLSWDFLSHICLVHWGNSALIELMKTLWERNRNSLERLVLEKKISLTKNFETSKVPSVERQLRQIAALSRASPDLASYLMTGSDYLDSLVTLYAAADGPEERRAVFQTAYLSLQALALTQPPNTSLVCDHLYSLKSHADIKAGERSLVSDVVTNTPLIAKLGGMRSSTSLERLSTILATLEAYRSPNMAMASNPSRKGLKGKGKAVETNDELDMLHRSSLVTQIQDLFPELGSGFVLKLLHEYQDDVEQATAHLLDDSLPPHLRNADRSEDAAPNEDSAGAADAPSTLPTVEPTLPERRNVYDGDELDRLEFDRAKLHIGKKDRNLAGEQPHKAAIWAALATFDSADDERDDTYDVDDVGGTVDTAHVEGELHPSHKVRQDEEVDAVLFAAYKNSPELFGRTFDVRKGQARQALKSETAMTDEAIEGWAIMLQRDPQRLRRLEAQHFNFDGRQNEINRTSYRQPDPGAQDVQRGGFRGSSRGSGRAGGFRGRGRGGSVAGPSNDPESAAAQRSKEANKSSRANHNRRDQRARKMARGGFAG